MPNPLNWYHRQISKAPRWLQDVVAYLTFVAVMALMKPLLSLSWPEILLIGLPALAGPELIAWVRRRRGSR